LAIPHLPCPDGDEVVIKSKAKEVAGSDKAAARAVRQPTNEEKDRMGHLIETKKALALLPSS
jgi:hypothetical protein